MEQLILRFAENIVGPTTYRYIRILKENRYLIDVDLEILTRTFTSCSVDLIEETCFRAMDRGIKYINLLPELVEEIEKEGF